MLGRTQTRRLHTCIHEFAMRCVGSCVTVWVRIIENQSLLMRSLRLTHPRAVAPALLRMRASAVPVALLQLQRHPRYRMLSAQKAPVLL